MSKIPTKDVWFEGSCPFATCLKTEYPWLAK